MNLLEVYEEMVKTATEAEAAEEVQAEEQATVDERVEVLAKYATAADKLLADEYGEDYGEEDVEKLAAMMIEHDVEQEEIVEKVAELDQAGRIMARAFKDELEKGTDSKEEEASEE